MLEALKKAIVERTDSVERRLVFLGDNIYPSGLPPEGAEAEERSEAERRILAQIDVALETATPTIFVPGNHDWDYPQRRRMGSRPAAGGVRGSGR